MLAFIYDGPGNLALREVDAPRARADSAVIKVNATSICGTDLRTFRFGSSKIKGLPRIIGHEAVGTIVEIGDNIKNFKLGDCVQVAPAIGCGHCKSCKKGKTNLCDNLRTIGFDFDGTFAQYMEIPAEAFEADHVTLIPDNLKPIEAVLAEPIACVYNAQEYLHISKGDTVAIFGSGFIGTMHAELAFRKGASKVFLIEVNETRINTAREIHPELITINSAKEDFHKIVMDNTDSQGVDVAIVACSVGAAQVNAMSIIAKAGRVSLFGGLPTESAGFIDSNIIHYKEVGVFGCHASTVAQNRMVLNMISEGKLDVSPFTKKTFALSDINEAFQQISSELILKAIIVPEE
ncbi:MAG: alcohol dehydrogenase catalytic domain-containing protein [Clostridia bacterium]|nr:alcohol dehydrogenase catalytic domain-containing protein [Clostridia bacterium]